uniref:Uncharacterized protein n=1 Tax=viral metagenome TaxID=1070528 RepID=A0A6M3IMJ6_9ZZZZ
MDTLRAVFDAPKGCSNKQLEQISYINGQKFLEAMDDKGWVLRSPLDFYQDAAASRKDVNNNHYVAVGRFDLVNRHPDTGTIELPDSVVQNLLRTMPEKVKILK